MVHRPMSPSGFILYGAIVVALLGCDPLSRTTLLVAVPSQIGDPSAPTLRVSTADAETVVTIVAQVAAIHGLERRDAPVGELAFYSRGWDSNAEDHARGIVLSVQAAERPGVIEVTVDEWLALRHSHLGRQILSELQTRLREKFGPDAVSIAHLEGVQWRVS